MQIRFDDALKVLTKPYEIRMCGGPGDAREAVALADLYIRIVYTLVVAASHEGGGSALRAAPTPGLGVMLAAVRGTARWATLPNERWHRNRIRMLASGTIAMVEAFQGGPLYSSFKTLRDRFSHGTPLPSSDSEANRIALELRRLCENLRSAISTQLGACQLVAQGARVLLTLSDKDTPADLSPLWMLASAELPLVGIYSHLGNDQVYYLLGGGELTTIKTQNFDSAAKSCLQERSPDDRTLGSFVKDVVRDVAAFTEDNSSPSYYFGDEIDAGHLFIPWTLPKSEGNQPRVDVFRIGPDNQRQWLRKGLWQGYSTFLRHVVNWPFLARRVRIGLDQLAKQRNEEEKSRFGLLGATADETIGPSRLIEVTEALEPGSGEELGLLQRADDACQSLKAFTTVFFIVGQAGLGKTQIMLSLAQKRAGELENQPENLKPLYLFVSSTGRTLASLDDAVNSALNNTKLLSSQGAKALCRNGLVVLFVDGFDELLGSSGYENALGSLEPWFRELSGRGVLVASARSSYYLTQYRRSLSETTGLNIDHTLAEIQPWSRDEVEAYFGRRGTPASTWKNLDSRDWELLGVPFFAKAFCAWHETHAASHKNSQSIFDIVVEQYLHRESSKLNDPHRGPLLSRDELETLFTEVAELMFLTKSRELDQASLINCAQMAICEESLDDKRPGLSRRLTALCGLDANQISQGATSFSFSHEVMFDCFLSLVLRRWLEQAPADENIRRLEKGKVHQAVFDWVVKRGPQSAKAGLISILSRVQVCPTGALADNLGALWMSLLLQDNGVPPTSVVKGLSLGVLELSTVGWMQLTLDSCDIEVLVIPPTGRCSISAPRSRIKVVRCDTSSRLADTLRDVDPSLIQALQFRDSYVDIPSSVRWNLGQCKIVPVSAPAADRTRRDAAEYFLEKLMTRADKAVIVYASDHLADDARLRWTKRLGDDAWLQFVDDLIRCDLAEWDTIEAGGAPKLRLVFDVPPAHIAQQESTDKRVRAFWQALSIRPL